MKKIYEEMQERLKFLETQEQTEEIKYRISEIILAILRVQQLLLVEINTDNISGLFYLPTKDEIMQVLYKCAKIKRTDEGIKMERLFEEEAKAVLALISGNKY